MPRSKRKARDLIDDAGALADQSLMHPVQGLQIELSDSLGCHKLHRRALYGLGNRLCVTEVVLLPLRIGRCVFSRHQPGIMAKCRQLPAQMMGPDASFHADQA